MSESAAPYGEPLSGPALERAGRELGARLQAIIPLQSEEATAFGMTLCELADDLGTEPEELSFADLFDAFADRAHTGRKFLALGKVDGLWHTIADENPLRVVPIGNGRRHTLTPSQLLPALRYETALLARRAGRRAGFERTFAHPEPATNETYSDVRPV